MRHDILLGKDQTRSYRLVSRWLVTACLGSHPIEREGLHACWWATSWADRGCCEGGRFGEVSRPAERLGAAPNPGRLDMVCVNVCCWLQGDNIKRVR